MFEKYDKYILGLSFIYFVISKGEDSFSVL